jgi:hypothetical protein
MNFFNIAAANELLDHAREIAAATVLQIHAVCDLADARRLRKSCEVSDHLLLRHFGRRQFLSRLKGVAFHAVLISSRTGYRNCAREAKFGLDGIL